MELDRGKEVDRYSVEELLGEGGMAVVYRVRHRALGSVHALKVPKSASPRLRERLLREGRVQATLNHPNVVAVTDVVDVEGVPCLVMQYVDGPSLESHLQAGRLPLPEAERLFRGVLDAVEAAHAVGVIHRDLKPANVLLARTSQGLVPRVADFGIARAVDEAEGVRITRTNASVGTPLFMAPEQFGDARNADSRADIFSLGCILYELVCGATAFSGATVFEVFERSSAGAYLDPGVAVPGLPERVRTAIRGALVPDRQHRIPDCATLRAVLDGARAFDVLDTPYSRSGPTTETSLAAAQTLPSNATLKSGEDGDPARTEPRAGDGGARRLWPALAAAALVALAVIAGSGLVEREVAPPSPPRMEPAPAPTVPADLPAPVVTAVEVPGDPPPAAPATPSPDVASRGPRERERPTPPATAHVTVNVAGVRLVGAAGSFEPGEVAPGRYSVVWTLDGVTGGAGDIEVGAGQRVRLECDPAFRTCERR